MLRCQPAFLAVSPDANYSNRFFGQHTEDERHPQYLAALQLISIEFEYFHLIYV